MQRRLLCGGGVDRLSMRLAPRHVPRILLHPSQRQSTLPHELSLRGTRIPDANLDMGMDGRTRSEYFADKSINNPFVAILMAPRLFPWKMLDTSVLKTRSTPHIAAVIIKYREEEHTPTKSFSSLIFDTGTPAKLNACNAACEYITRNFMDELKQLDNDTLMSDNGSDGNQYEYEDHNANNMLDQPHIEGIPE